jgi:hypothetical protein
VLVGWSEGAELLDDGCDFVLKRVVGAADLREDDAVTGRC